MNALEVLRDKIGAEFPGAQLEMGVPTDKKKGVWALGVVHQGQWVHTEWSAPGRRFCISPSGPPRGEPTSEARGDVRMPDSSPDMVVGFLRAIFATSGSHGDG